MNYLIAIIFGAVQGATEFFPVSSSGHLALLHRFLRIPLANELSFDVALHLATLFALVYFFRKDVLRLALAWFRSFGGSSSPESRFAWIIIIGTLPAVLIGAFLNDLAETALRSPWIIAAALGSVAVVFFLIERLGRQNLTADDLNWRSGLAIGTAQGLALIPGVSRSGITIIAGMALGLKRSEAARFSFILSMPIIAGAAFKELPKIMNGPGMGGGSLLLAIAFLAALVTSFAAIKYFLKFTENHSLRPFAWYRLAFAALVLLFLA